MQRIHNLSTETFTTFRIDLLCRRQRHFFDRLTGGTLNIAQHAFLATADKHNRFAFAARTTGTANTVNVRLGILRNIVVNHVTDALNVQTTSRNVGRYDHVQLASFQFFDRTFTLLLRNITVQRRTLKAIGDHEVGNFFCGLLSADEDHHGIEIFSFSDTQQRIVFMHWADKPITLTDLIVGRGLGFDFYLDRIIQVSFRDTLNFARHGGREQSHLTL